MNIPIHLSAKGVELSPDQEALIRASVDGLERFFPRLVACRVVVSAPHRRPRGEPVAWSLHLSLTVPGGELAVTRQAKPAFREALDDAFDAARRQLQDHRTGGPRRREDPRRGCARPQSVVERSRDMTVLELMAPESPAVGTERAVLEQMSALRAEGALVASLYVRLEVQDRVRNRYFIAVRDAVRRARATVDQLDLPHGEHEAFNRDLGRMEQFLGHAGRLPHSPGLALFACEALESVHARAAAARRAHPAAAGRAPPAGGGGGGRRRLRPDSRGARGPGARPVLRGDRVRRHRTAEHAHGIHARREVPQRPGRLARLGRVRFPQPDPRGTPPAGGRRGGPARCARGRAAVPGRRPCRSIEDRRGAGAVPAARAGRAGHGNRAPQSDLGHAGRGARGRIRGPRRVGAERTRRR